MSNQVKNISGDITSDVAICPLASDELKKLESCIDLLVSITNSLKKEMEGTSNKTQYIRCAKAIQSNIESVRKLTVSIYEIKLKERKANEKDISPSDWEAL